MTKCGGGRIALLLSLYDNGPTVWSILARTYYGEDRYKGNKARTSFMNQLKKLMSFGYIEKRESMYHLTKLGMQYLDQFSKKELTNPKSDAQIKWEVANG